MRTKGTAESVSCSLLKLLCLAPDLEPRSEDAANLNKIEDNEIDNEGYDFSVIAAMVEKEESNKYEKAISQKSTTSKSAMSQSFSLSGGSSSTSRRPLSYLDKVVKEWTSDPAIRGKDSFLPGKSLDTLNELFSIGQKELPNDSMINAFTGKPQNSTQLVIRFAEEIVQNIFSKADQIPVSIKAFLIEIIENTKEGNAGVLSLADAFVLTGFFIQKWIAFGFRWCLTKLREQLKDGLSASQGAHLVECIRIAQQLVFCIFTFNGIEGATGARSRASSQFNLEQMNAFVLRYASRVPNFYR